MPKQTELMSYKSLVFWCCMQMPTLEDDDDFELFLEQCVCGYAPERTGLRDLMDDGRRPHEEDESISDASIRLEIERELTQRNRLSLLRMPSVKAVTAVTLNSP